MDRPEQLAPYLASFSVVFNVGQTGGSTPGGWLVALTGPSTALAIDAATYLVPIASVIWLLRPHLENWSSAVGQVEGACLLTAWKDCGSTLRHVLRFTALSCLVGFFHPGLAPLIAAELIGPSPQALGLFTSVLAAGSITGGLVLRRSSQWLSQRPGVLMGTCTVITALAQMGMAWSGPLAFSLVMTFLIGAGTASLLTGVNLIGQVGSPMVLRGRMAGMGQIAFLGAGGISGLMAAGLAGRSVCCHLRLLGAVGFAAWPVRNWAEEGGCGSDQLDALEHHGGQVGGEQAAADQSQIQGHGHDVQNRRSAIRAEPPQSGLQWILDERPSSGCPPRDGCRQVEADP